MVAEFSILDRMLDFMAMGPSVKDIMSFKATAEEDLRLNHLLALNREGTISTEETKELDQMLLAGHMMIRAKAIAYGKLNAK